MTFQISRVSFAPVALVVSMFFAPIILTPTIVAQETARLTLPDAPIPQTDAAVPDRLVEQASSSQETAPSQQAAPPATVPQGPMTDADRKKAAEAQLQQELHQRMAGIVPNFNAVLSGDALPLSGRQKIRASFRGAIDPYQFGLALFTSGYGQATDSHSTIDPDGSRHGYGQGAAGYGKRFGSSYADQFTGAILGNGVFPALLHQDPRYYRMGTGGFKKRFLYALSTTVVCRSDKGKLQPNYSNLLGNLASGGISNLYYPKADRGFELTIQQGLEVTAEGSIGALLIEFYPDIRKHYSKKHSADPSTAITPH